MSFLVPFLLDDDTSATIAPGPVRGRRRVPGPMGLTDPYALSPIRPASVAGRRRVPGIGADPLPSDDRPIRPLAIGGRRRVPGAFLPSAAPELAAPGPALLLGGIAYPSGVAVVDYPHATAAQVHPRLNDTGQASFTTPPPGPDPGDLIGFTVAGSRIFTGYPKTITAKVRDANEEAGQLVAVDLVGLLDEFRDAIVLPDMGARGPNRLGSPTQDVRVFDWTMNGAGAVDFGGDPLDLVPSVSIDATAAHLAGTFHLPDVWPDPWARWTWVHDPRIPARRGWCHFRVPTPPGAGRTHLWAAAHDYAEVWVDGVPMLTCDTPGVAQRVELDASAHHHNITVRAYNDRGRAGFLFSMLPVDADGLYGPPTMNSRSNWKCLAYSRRSLVSTPGQVLLRLRLEAAERNLAAGEWRFTFDGRRDSAGRPWPRLDPVTVDVGKNYLEVLQQLAEDRLDFAAAPAGRVLHAWVKDRGTGRARGLPWTETVDMTSRAIKAEARP